MIPRLLACALVLALAAPGPLLAAPPKAGDAARLKLLPGARGTLCLGCHENFRGRLAREAVHTPVRSGECVSCHNPHASDHGRLLASGPNTVCFGCHQKLVPAGARSVHKPASEGSCSTCHDAHSAHEKNLLLKPAVELCAGCHQELWTTAQKATVKHQPLQEGGCTTCHNPHASVKGERLLVEREPQLCLGCHKSSTPAFAKAHEGYPVASAGCTTCHDPHGSNTPKMLRGNVHQPVALRQCDKCHNPPSPAGMTMKASGAELCGTCHAEQIARMVGRSQVHWAMAGERACLTCHDPHASASGKLVAGKMTAVCGQCHADTVARHDRSPTPHQPVGGGQCAACHDPHSADGMLLLKRPDIIETCATCHDWQRHSSHPLGDKVRDPRNRNLTIDCLSCHRAHGTEYKHLMPTPSTTELCIRCHEQYRR